MESFTEYHFQAASRNEGESVTLDMVGNENCARIFFGPEYFVQSSANQPQVGEGVEDMKREQVMTFFD